MIFCVLVLCTSSGSCAPLTGGLIPRSRMLLTAASADTASSTALAYVRSFCARRVLCMLRSFTPQTKRSRSMSSNVVPKSQYSESDRSSATYVAIDSPAFRTREWNLKRSTMTEGIGLKCFDRAFTSSSYVFSPGLFGDRFRSVL